MGEHGLVAIHGVEGNVDNGCKKVKKSEKYYGPWPSIHSSIFAKIKVEPKPLFTN